MKPCIQRKYVHEYKEAQNMKIEKDKGKTISFKMEELRFIEQCENKVGLTSSVMC